MTTVYGKLFFAFHRDWSKAEVCFWWHYVNCLPWGCQNAEGKLAFPDSCLLWVHASCLLTVLFMPAAWLSATLPSLLGFPLSPFTYASLLNLWEKVCSSFSLVSCSQCSTSRGVVLGRSRVSRRWSPWLKLHDPTAWSILFPLGDYGASLYLFSVYILSFDIICLTQRLRRYPPSQTTVFHAGKWF